MIRSTEDLLAVVTRVYGSVELPKAFRVLAAALRVRAGERAQDLAREVGSTSKHLQEIASAPDPAVRVLKCSITEVPDKSILKARINLGQLLIGLLAELTFVKMYRETMGTHELKLIDDRSARGDTDYLVVNGQARPVFRINIKFHASRFRNAGTLVGLEPDDCFALATYKIYQGLQKQEREVLNYVFVVIGVPELTGEQVGQVIEDDFVLASAFVNQSSMSGKRAVEERIVDHLVLENPPPQVRERIADFSRRIEAAEWRVISARKADKLLREKLFDRVYAVRVRAFARNYPNAELDMHFSIRDDLTTLADFLTRLRTGGPQGLSTSLERGAI